MVDDLIGNLFIVAAPSGGGKTSLVKQLINKMEDIEVSISHTTRPKRPNEIHGKDYYFVDDKSFDAMVYDGDFIEYATVFGHQYGTAKTQIYDRLKKGIDIILDIDWQGAQQIKQEFEQAVGVFIIPPSLDALKNRLFERQQDDQAVISHRMKKAQNELSHYHEFDYLVVNDQFELALTQLESIVLSNRLLQNRQSKKLRSLLHFLLADNQAS